MVGQSFATRTVLHTGQVAKFILLLVARPESGSTGNGAVMGINFANRLAIAFIT
jgi:hypothetical protein